LRYELPSPGLHQHDLFRDVRARRRDRFDQPRAGIPDTDGPDAIKRAAIRAIESGPISIRPWTGSANCVSAIAWHQKHYNGLDFSPENEILVTTGATEAIARVSLVTVRDRRRGRDVQSLALTTPTLPAPRWQVHNVVSCNSKPLSGRLTATPLRARSPIGLGSYW